MNFDMPKDYVSLNLGSESAQETQADVKPATNTSNSLSIAPATAPPEGYAAGYTSPLAREMEDSTLQKVARFFVGASTQPGDVNVLTRTRLAEHNALLEESKTKLAWENFHQHKQSLELTAKEQNQAMMFRAFEAAPSVKGMIASITDPAERDAAVEFHAKNFDSMSPGFGKVFRAMGQSRAWVLGADELLSDPGPAGKAAREVSNGMSYENWVSHPATRKAIESRSKDMMPLVVTRFTKDEQLLLSSGKMTEPQFRAAFKTAAMDESFRTTPRGAAYAQSILEEPFAQDIMAGMGVRLDATAHKMQLKEKPAGSETMGGIAAQEYRKHEAHLKLEEEHPGSFSPEHIKNAKKQMGLLLKTESKDQSENPNNSVIQRFRALALENGVSAENMEDIEKLKPGSPGQKLALSLWNKAQGEKDKASAASASAVRMSEPHDMNEKPVYKMDKQGNPVRITTPMTKGEYLSGKGGFTMTADQKEKLGTIDYAEKEGIALFDLADKAYTATSRFGKGAQTAAEKTLSSPLTAWTLSDTHPELKMYVDERNALLGKFSKSLGGEVGVLTNQDIERVIKVFPGAADNEKIRKMKRQAFQRIISLNKRAITKLLTANQGTEFEGTITPEQMSSMKNSKELRAEIEGTLGSMEGIGKQVEEAEKVPRGNSLLDEMRKGK